MEMMVYLKTALPSSHHRAPNVIMLVGKTSGVTWCQRLGRWASLSLSVCNLLPLSVPPLSHTVRIPSLPFSHSITLSDSPSLPALCPLSIFIHQPLNWHLTRLSNCSSVGEHISRHLLNQPVSQNCPLFGEDAPSSNSMNFWFLWTSLWILLFFDTGKNYQRF